MDSLWFSAGNWRVSPTAGTGCHGAARLGWALGPDPKNGRVVGCDPRRPADGLWANCTLAGGEPGSLVGTLKVRADQELDVCHLDPPNRLRGVTSAGATPCQCGIER